MIEQPIVKGYKPAVNSCFREEREENSMVSVGREVSTPKIVDSLSPEAMFKANCVQEHGKGRGTRDPDCQETHIIKLAHSPSHETSGLILRWILLSLSLILVLGLFSYLVGFIANANHRGRRSNSQTIYLAVRTHGLYDGISLWSSDSIRKPTGSYVAKIKYEKQVKSSVAGYFQIPLDGLWIYLLGAPITSLIPYFRNVSVFSHSLWKSWCFSIIRFHGEIIT